jgi:hypothetical protein
MDEVFSCGSMAEITGNAEYITDGQDFTADKRSLWKDGFVANATRATCRIKTIIDELYPNSVHKDSM